MQPLRTGVDACRSHVELMHAPCEALFIISYR